MNKPPDANANLIRSAQFRKGREDGWKKLELLLDRVESEGIRALSPDAALELPLLYRGALSSLSVARSIALDRNLLRYLEDLSFRAYLAVYGPRARLLDRALEFVRTGFPRTVREMRWHVAAAFVFLAAGMAAGYLLVGYDMEYYGALIPAELAGDRVPGASAAELRRHIFAPWPGFMETFVVFANSLFRHNAVIGILCFGLGFALGLPTIFLLLYNGMSIGAIIALHAEKGLSVDFVGWLSIHGVTELLAVILCGAAGFVLAEKILFPGRLTRLENLSRHGRTAASAVAGAVAIFFVAGIIEGGFRQLINNTPGRYAFAALTAAAWLYYFMACGKARDNGDNI